MKKYYLNLYHGTNESCSKQILESGFKLPTPKRDDHWLGEGVYFFREDEDQARIWGQNRYKGEKSKAVVLEANVTINAENYLDLDSRSGLAYFKEHTDNIEHTLETNGYKLKSDNPNKMRHLACGMLPVDYKVIKRTFEGNSSFDYHESLMMMKLKLNGVQVCIRDVSVIQEVKAV
ncbi:hypothetical protein [Paenibacillus xylanexedens]|uniref:hypothetical protein n=1 Tax=Paenibacillus xylanexedens TaxID=528191 RepID=UPI001643B05C|nr:hypothetical protein [Paenibacillus xylanexedens]